MNAPLPTVPTDNLYKFLAIFGLILFIASNAYIWIVVESLEKDVVVLEGEILASETDASYLGKDVESLRERVRDWHQRVEEANAAKRYVEAEKYEKESMKLQGELSDLEKGLLERKLELIDVATKSKLVQLRIRQIKYYRTILRVMNLLSSALIGFGFYLWYYKLQRYLDQQVAQSMHPRRWVRKHRRRYRG